ncbi:hypothetical protein Y1Q_0018971 [Alligator mississippiensis]|uniref:Uncharacterized protein n=1 Tax=Alligator mississippiensis TaxID=8496 RepID=A0A151M3J3_ALLMI|nr:hypothetical protein Y1Q_0018971 [Alligator mississippiensis]
MNTFLVLLSSALNEMTITWKVERNVMASALFGSIYCKDAQIRRVADSLFFHTKNSFWTMGKECPWFARLLCSVLFLLPCKCVNSRDNMKLLSCQMFVTVSDAQIPLFGT